MLFSHEGVWRQIGRLSATSNRKMAAVAYVSSDIVVKFSSDDILVTNATDEAVAAGLTSARVLQRARMRGARIISVPNLHAKVMVFDKTLVLGSANLSVNSQRTLIEAVVVTDAKKYVMDARRLIGILEGQGTALDDARISQLLRIDVRRPTSSARSRKLGEPHIIFFKQVMPGDVRKYARHSADAPSGGGARDLRVPLKYDPLLRQMVSEPTDTRGITHGAILSHRAGKVFASTDVELWRPTASRVKELRFPRIYGIPGWAVYEDEYSRAALDGQELFFVLEMDLFGTVFAKVLSREDLVGADPLIGQHIARLLATRHPRRALVGAIDLVRRVAIP